MKIQEFLLERIAEDEAAARAISGSTVEGEPGNWNAVASGDEWAVSNGEFDVEVLVALRPGLPTPPQAMSGQWGQVFGWEYVEPEHRGYALAAAEHIARHDPARVLAECATKRRILFDLEPHRELCGSGPTGDAVFAIASRMQAQTLGLLAATYAHHPDYQQEWAL